MRGAVPFSVLLLSALLLSGCFGDAALDPAGEGDEAPAPRRGQAEQPTGSIGLFDVTPRSGKAPIEVEFQYFLTTNDDEATWVIEFGDGATRTGGSTEFRGRVPHTYTTGGTFEPTLTLTYGGDRTTSLSVVVKIEPPLVVPDPGVFEYGPSLGCVTATGVPQTCISFHLGPDAPAAVDGHWQALDGRYWGLQFLATNEPDTYEDTDCAVFDQDLQMIAPMNQGDDPCGGILPSGTAYIFMYSWIAPSPGMRLEFFLPTE